MIFIEKSLIGMVHVRALPGTPLSRLSMKQIIELAVCEAQTLQKCGFDGIILENMHDMPYQNRDVNPEIIAAMAIIAKAVKQSIDLPVGIQVLAGANIAAMAIAKTAGLDFIRAEGYVYAHIADEGMINADSAQLQRYRKSIGAEHIEIFADIKKKHSSHAITSDVGIVETAHTAEFFLADGVIVTGSSTGKEADLRELAAVKEAVNIKVMIGSGITAANIKSYWKTADALIVGSYIKKDGLWSNELDADKCRRLVKIITED